MADRPDDPGPPTQAFAAQPSEQSAPPPAWVLSGRYRVTGRLGAGGMAQVFRARDELLDRDVAVKVFRTPVDEPGNVSSVERRGVELQALARLSHPNLTALYDGSLADDGPAYLVMEFVDGPDLASRLDDGPLTYAEAQLLGAQIAGALAYVHARGMVHRDVKPANILLGSDGDADTVDGLRARLSDFGIVRMVNAPQLTHASFTLGSASYLAPEQARGSNVGPSADVYALGLVLLEALTGVRAYDGPIHEAVAARLVRPPDIPATLRPPWPGLLAAMTALDPTVRPSAGEVSRVLSGRPGVRYPVSPTAATAIVGPTAATVASGAPAFAAGPMPVGPVPPGRPPTGSRALGTLPPGPDSPEVRSSRRNRQLLIGLAAAAAVIVLGLVLFLVLRPSSSDPSPDPSVSTSPTRSSPSVSPTRPPSSSERTSSESTSPSSSNPPTSRSSSRSSSSQSSSSSSSSASTSKSSRSSQSSRSSRSSSGSSSSSSAAGGAADGPPTPVRSTAPSGSSTSTS